MKSLAAEFTSALRREDPVAELLEIVGDPEPRDAAEAFAQAVLEPGLATSIDAWAPALLASARPGVGARRLVEVARAAAQRGRAPAMTEISTLASVVGSSDFLARLLARRSGLLDDLCARDLHVDIAPTADWDAIRMAKYRGLLHVAAGDLGDRPFRDSLAELSDLSDGCLRAASRCTATELQVEEPALFALGKLGGRELNFSSDVDLLFLYDSPRGEDDFAAKQAAARFIRHFKRQLEVPTPEGFGYRVDLDLRPEGTQGGLANSVNAALDYYEAFGAEWERQMMIRLRALCGPPAALRAFEAGIQPFVYRRTIGPAVLRSVRAMKERIETERLGAGRDPELDLKEGPGGIRDVEFLVQALQLFWGGRQEQLRTGNTLLALERLHALGKLPGDAASELAEAYEWLRRAEHAEQMAEERQVSRFPRDRAGRLRLARRMGYTKPSGDEATRCLEDDHDRMRARVKGHFDALVLGGSAS